MDATQTSKVDGLSDGKARTRVAGAWSTQKIVETLMLKNAHSAMRGKPCPVAARVAERLAAQL